MRIKLHERVIDQDYDDFDDENTIILCVKLMGGLLLSQGTRSEF